MNYIELLNRFWDRNRDDHFTPSTIALYLFLLDTNNRYQWPESFQLRTEVIVERLGIHRHTIESARKNLIDAGLISVTSLRGIGPVSYKICDADVKNLKKKRYLDFVDRSTMIDQIVQNLCNSWGEHSRPGAEKIAILIVQKLSNLENRIVQSIVQSIVQILSNYTLYNDNTNVLSKDKRNIEIPPIIPLGDRKKFDDFLAQYFDESRRGSIEAICMNLGVTYDRFKRLSEMAIDEMCACAEEFTDFNKIGKKMQNLVRLKVRYGEGEPKAIAKPFDIPLGPGEYFDNARRRRYDDSPIEVPLSALPRPSVDHVWDVAKNRWVDPTPKFDPNKYKLGPGEFFDENNSRLYDYGNTQVPYDAPPRPSAQHRWSTRENKWTL